MFRFEPVVKGAFRTWLGAAVGCVLVMIVHVYFLEPRLGWDTTTGSLIFVVLWPFVWTALVAALDATRWLDRLIGICERMTRILAGYERVLHQLASTISAMLDAERPTRNAGTSELLLLRAEVDRRMADLRTDVTSDLTANIRDVEQRLRGEWRFVVGLIVTVLLGAVGIFVALVRPQ